MNCTNPQMIYPHRTVDWIDQHEEYPVSVPCGKCIPCLINKRTDWSFRLEQEYKVSSSAHFVTLTYDQKHQPSDGSLDKRHVQLYLKRLRKLDGTNKIRYYAVGEYGSKSSRPHYHLLLFNCCVEHCRQAWRDSKGASVGIVHIGAVTSASVAYVTKYIVQPDCAVIGLQKPFSLMSRAYGIGGRYLTDEMVEWHRNDDRNYVDRYGVKGRLPRFYREKIWWKPVDRERVSSKAMKLTLDNQESERKYYQSVYGENWEPAMIESRNAVIARVKSKVAFTQTF